LADLAWPPPLRCAQPGLREMRDPKTLPADRSDEKVKAPNTNIQAPKKLQIPSSKSCGACLMFEVWSFSGCWSLELGAFFPAQ
jgi:hypothetical protein